MYVIILVAVPHLPHQHCCAVRFGCDSDKTSSPLFVCNSLLQNQIEEVQGRYRTQKSLPLSRVQKVRAGFMATLEMLKRTRSVRLTHAVCSLR